MKPKAGDQYVYKTEGITSPYVVYIRVKSLTEGRIYYTWDCPGYDRYNVDFDEYIEDFEKKKLRKLTKLEKALK